MVILVATPPLWSWEPPVDYLLRVLNDDIVTWRHYKLMRILTIKCFGASKKSNEEVSPTGELLGHGLKYTLRPVWSKH